MTIIELRINPRVIQPIWKPYQKTSGIVTFRCDINEVCPIGDRVIINSIFFCCIADITKMSSDSLDQHRIVIFDWEFLSTGYDTVAIHDIIVSTFSTYMPPKAKLLVHAPEYDTN